MTTIYGKGGLSFKEKRIRRIRAGGCARLAAPETQSRVPTTSEYTPGDRDPLPEGAWHAQVLSPRHAGHDHGGREHLGIRGVGSRLQLHVAALVPAPDSQPPRKEKLSSLAPEPDSRWRCPLANRAHHAKARQRRTADPHASARPGHPPPAANFSILSVIPRSSSTWWYEVKLATVAERQPSR